MTAHRAAPKSAEPAGAPSLRVRLARLAWERALSTDGVAAGDSGGRGAWQTEDRGEALPGVLATASGDASFDVELHLVAAWPPPPLHEVANTIRDRINEAAVAAGLGEALGAVEIAFGDVAEPPDEVAD